MRCGVRARLDFNPRSPDGERPSLLRETAIVRDFNPRSPDGERRRIVRFQASRPDISIHAPRMGSDRRFRPFAPRNRYFNPRSPDGERLMQNHLISSDFVISIHAPRMGSDRVNWYDDYHDVVFQSTLPGWGATPDRTVPGFPAGYFNPRSPDGERPPFSTICATESVFQSTLPGWGATHAKSFDFKRLCNFNPRSPDGERPCELV